MNESEESEIYRRAIEKFGTMKQLEMMIEEASELIQAIQKYKRYGMSENLKEELADVSIMVDQLAFAFNVDKIKGKKLVRLLKLLNN